jgi:hypothetical protein
VCTCIHLTPGPERNNLLTYLELLKVPEKAFCLGYVSHLPVIINMTSAENTAAAEFKPVYPVVAWEYQPTGRTRDPGRPRMRWTIELEQTMKIMISGNGCQNFTKET